MQTMLRGWTVWAVALGWVAAAGCQERTLETYTTDIDAAAAGGAGGEGFGAGGMGGGSAGTSGDGGATAGAGGGARDAAVSMSDACVPSGGPETCNGRDDDCNGRVDDVPAAMLQSDPLACGSCNTVCPSPANALPKCAAGQCTYDCETGAVDIDKGGANGCECLVTNNGTEICDTRDNDCDGMVDEGFDKQGDVKNCGGCNVVCVFPFAEAACMAGRCTLVRCRAGFFDRDRNPANGCESACGRTNNGVEACDGVDNDCDGMIDNGATPPSGFLCKAMGVCAGARPECKDLGGGIKGWACSYNADFEDPEAMAKGCDGKDNDCDGKTDEAFGVGTACSVGVGACASMGMLVCDPMDRTKTTCSGAAKTPGMERCNGVDDDCDGKTDELASMADRTADDKLVYVPSADVTVFAYEASRFDATATSAGADSSQRPCSVPSKLPWSNVTKEEALGACRAIGTGWRLCTKDEWVAACKTPSTFAYPYGNAYDGKKCNGYDYVDRALMPDVTTVAAGAAAMCVAKQGMAADDSVFDMSGNVREWAWTTVDTEAFELRGGAYNVTSFETDMPGVRDAPGLKCDATIPAPTATLRLPSVGFRCCLKGRLP